jgi:hypothetical protein
MFAARQLIWGRKTMGNNLKNKRMSARRAAAMLAVLGVLVMSSGVALMVTATSANAAEKVQDWVCKYKGTPGVDEELKNGNDGLVWVDTDYPQGTYFNDAQGRSYVLAADVPHSPQPDSSNCPPPNGGPQDTPVAASVSFTDPSCANNNTASATPVATTGVSYALTSGTVAPGQHVVYTATALATFVLTNGPTFEHTFAAAAICSTTSTPTTTTVVSPPTTKSKTHTKTKATTTVTPTVVHAGLSGTTVQDVRGEQGLALMVAGMVMLVGAGGLRLRGRTSRI